jgi:adenosylhomocysteinase
MVKIPSDIKDSALWKEGVDKIEWARMEMPVLRKIEADFKKKKPFKDIRMAACLHVTTETANLMRCLKSGGADVHLCASNPLSTQDSTAAALVEKYGIPVYAIHGENNKVYYKHIHQVLDIKPHLTMDDGADLVSTLHKDRKPLIKGIIGGTEETTTGVIRLRSMAADKALKYPIVAVNDAMTKHFFDNRYGTGQSTIDGLFRSTNILLSGKHFVVAGYGWCGRGLAMRAAGMGARVIVTEIDHVKAIEAVMDGFDVMPMNDAASIGDIFITLTGNCNVINGDHFKAMKNGAIVANSGHFDSEIDLKALNKLAKKAPRRIRHELDEYVIGTKKIYLVAQGRLINLASAEGHPASVMDMSFANQALCSEYIIKNAKKLKKAVYPVPLDIDNKIAAIKLDTIGIKIDKLTKEQIKYLASWEEGT